MFFGDAANNRLATYPSANEMRNANVLTANGVMFVCPMKYEAIAAPMSPTQTPFVLARFVNMPRANTAAIGTPNRPVMLRNRFHVSSLLVDTRKRAADMPSTPERMIAHLASFTSSSWFLPTKRSLKSVTIHAEILLRLDDIVNCAAANMAAIRSPATPAGSVVTMKEGTIADVVTASGGPPRPF